MECWNGLIDAKIVISLYKDSDTDYQLNYQLQEGQKV